MSHSAPTPEIIYATNNVTDLRPGMVARHDSPLSDGYYYGIVESLTIYRDQINVQYTDGMNTWPIAYSPTETVEVYYVNMSVRSRERISR